jgi:hypothetical protein
MAFSSSELSFKLLVVKLRNSWRYMSETSVVKMLSLRNNLSRPEYNFVALAELMRYILRYTVKYWCNIVDYPLY